MSAEQVNQHANAKVPKGKGKGKGKQHKHFLEKKDALSLAASIAEEQETKASLKTERHHKPEADSRQKSDRKRISGSKEKLKETKAALKAKLLDTKRERSKSRKQRLKGEPSDEGEKSAPTNPGKSRKSVSFA